LNKCNQLCVHTFSNKMISHPCFMTSNPNPCSTNCAHEQFNFPPVSTQWKFPKPFCVLTLLFLSGALWTRVLSRSAPSSNFNQWVAQLPTMFYWPWPWISTALYKYLAAQLSCLRMFHEKRWWIILLIYLLRTFLRPSWIHLCGEKIAMFYSIVVRGLFSWRTIQIYRLLLLNAFLLSSHLTLCIRLVSVPSH
jgi:hypothetical protein